MLTIVAINLKHSFELLLVDSKRSKVFVNLRKAMERELLSSTRQSHVTAIEVNSQFFIVSTSNHNLICFSSVDGTNVPLRSITLHN